MSTKNPEIRELTLDEIETVSGAGSIGPFHADGNGFGLYVPGIINIGIHGDGEGGTYLHAGVLGHTVQGKIH